MAKKAPVESGTASAAQSIIKRLENWELKAAGESVDSGSSPGLIEECKRHPSTFRNNLLRNRAGTSELIGEKLDPWQRQDLEAMDPAWMFAAGLSEKKPPKQRAYLERARGHSKTSDLAIQVCWALLASPRMIMGASIAAREEQAAELLQAAQVLIHDNPWMSEILDIQKSEITNKRTGSSCKVAPAKGGTNYGRRLSFCIADELTHWTDESVWTAIFSGMAKVNESVLVAISNSGYGKGRSWQWKLRERLREDPAWYFHSLEGVQASWLEKESLEEQARVLDDDEYRRLWLNQWLSETAGGIPYGEIRRATTQKFPTWDKSHGCEAVIAGLDVGIVKDRTSLVFLGVDTENRCLKLLGHQTWKPSEFKTKRVDLETIETAILAGEEIYGRLDALYADDWQAIGTLQRLSKHFHCEEIPFSSSQVRRDMARLLTDAFQSGWLQLYPDEVLERDLLSLEVVQNETSRIKVLQASRDEYGHADSAFALAIAVMRGWAWLQELTAGSGAERETSMEQISLL